MWLFVLFIAVPLIEIALFIQVGGLIGLWPTLAIVLLTAMAGTTLMRSQGARAWIEVQRSFAEMRDPTRPMAHGAMILFAGALLLTPGFFTDALGLALLIPGFRDLVIRWLGRRVQVTRVGMGAPPDHHFRHPAGEDVIDAEYSVDSDDDPSVPPHSGGSGWTRH